MKGFLYSILSFAFRLVFFRNFSVIKIGSRSTVAFWRIRPNHRNSFYVGPQSIVRGKFVFEKEKAKISIGSNTFIGAATFSIAENLVIGDHVMIAWGATVFDHGAHPLNFSERKRDPELLLEGKKDWTFVKIAPVRIDSKVWIGLNAIILSGVHVGEGAVVAAGSVVTKDVPAWTVVAGNPAQVIKKLSGVDKQPANIPTDR